MRFLTNEYLWVRSLLLSTMGVSSCLAERSALLAPQPCMMSHQSRVRIAHAPSLHLLPNVTFARLMTQSPEVLRKRDHRGISKMELVYNSGLWSLDSTQSGCTQVLPNLINLNTPLSKQYLQVYLFRLKLVVRYVRCYYSTYFLWRHILGLKYL